MEQWHRFLVSKFLRHICKCLYCTGMYLDSQGNKIYINHKSIDMFISLWLSESFHSEFDYINGITDRGLGGGGEMRGGNKRNRGYISYPLS